MNLVRADDFYWDSGADGDSMIGGSGAWNLSNPFFDPIGTDLAIDNVPWINGSHSAYFGGTPGTVTLFDPITAGGLVFNSGGYTLASNTASDTLTLVAPTGSQSPLIKVSAMGLSATIGTILGGTSGFTKVGNGTLRLTNPANTFTGDLAIKGGNLVVANAGALGLGTSAISVTGIANTGNPGFSGGSLILDGSAGGINLAREISVSGRGPGATNSSAGLISVGYNTLSSGLTLGSTASEGRALATHGITTVSGGLYLGTGGGAILTGNGNWIVSGQVTGSEVATDRFIKGGTTVIASTLWLQNPNNSFAETLRIDGGTVRVSTNTALGVNLGTQSVDLNNGGLEVRTDTPGVGNADFSTRKLFNRDNTNTGVFVSSGIGGTAINQTVTFGETRITGANTNFRVTGRNGYNTTFTGVGNSALGLIGQGGANLALIENNSSGMMTIAGSGLWNQTDGTSRTLSIQGNGETTVTGNILATGGGTGHNFTKAGTGTLVLQGTASTFAGAANVSGGTLSIGTIGALNANSAGRVVFGGGTLNYTGAGETWASKVLLLNTTNNIVTHNGTGALTLSQNVGNNGTGGKNLVLGGSNLAINQLTGIVVNTTAGAGLTKTGTGTWQITAPGTGAAQIGTANAAFAVTANGTASQTVTTASTAGLVVGQPVSGGAIPAGTVISQIISATQFAISQSSVIPASINIGTVNGSTASLNVTASTTGNVLTVASTANLVPGQSISGPGLAAGDGWFVSAINSATTFTVANSTNTGALLANAAVGTQNPLTSPNFGGNLTIGNGILRLNPTAAGLGSDVVNNGSGVNFAADAITGAGNAGGVLDYRGFTGGSSEVLGRLAVTAGNAIVRITPADGTNSLTFGSIAAPSLGSSLNFEVPGTPGTNSVVITKGTTAGLLNAHAYFNGADFAYSPGGIDAVLRAPDYGVDPTFTAVNTLTAATNVAISSNAATGGALAVTSLKISGNTPLTLAGLLTVGGATGGGILVTGATTGATITGTGVTTGSLGDLSIRVNGANDRLTLSAPVTATTTGGVTKNGAGTLVLNAANAQTGTFTVNEGTVRLSGAGTTLGINAGTTTPAVVLRQNTTLDLGGVSGLVSGALSGSGTVTNMGAANTWTVGNNNGSGVFSGVLSDGSGILGFTKSGTGTQSMTGANTHTGITSINGGTLAVTDIAGVSGVAATTNLTTTVGDATATVDDATGLVVGQTLASNPNIVPGTTITAINGNVITLSNPALATAATVGTGFGAVSSLGWSSAAAGNLVFNGGILQYTGSNAAIFRTTQTPSVSTDREFTLAGNGTIQSSGQYGNNVLATGAANHAALIFASTADLSFAGAGIRTLTLGGTSIGDNVMNLRLRNNPNAGEALSFTKADAGLWILNPSTSNTYSGPTSITGGALQVAPEGALVAGLPAASHLVLNGGVLQTSGTFTRTATAIAGTNTMQWTGNGGFSASTEKLTVNLGGGAITLGTAPYAGSTLILSSTTALADVELVNAINLGTAARTIQVDDNLSTGLDFATVSGIISGGAGGTLTKSGGGTLILGNNNNYVGNTVLNNGNLFVTSIGSGGASSSLGAVGGTLQMGAGTNTASLMYVGPGEAVTRPISLVGAAATMRIDSSGSGPLSLATISNASTGATLLELRGTNTDANIITSQLTNSGANVLSVQKTDGGVWILNPSVPNTFTGSIGVNQGSGLLGLTANGIGDASNITLTNGGIFAYGGPLVTAKPLILANNSAAVFAGSNAITFNSSVTKLAGNNSQTFSNNLEGGAVLTINGNFINSEAGTTAATQTISIRGYGSTVWNGQLTENAAAGGKIAWNIALEPNASFTMAGALGNTYSGGTTLTDGILIVDKTTTPLGSGIFAFNGGTLRAGATIVSPLVISNLTQINASPPRVDGTKSIEFSGAVTMGGSRNLQNELSGGANLILSGTVTNSAASTLTIYGAGNTLVPGNVTTGTGAQGLQLAGTGGLSLTGTNLATGALTASRGTITLSGTTGGSWNAGTMAVNPTGTLTLDNSGGNLAAGRLNDLGAFAGNGGTLHLISDGTSTSESIGVLSLNSVQTNITMAGLGSTTLTFSSMVNPLSGGSLDLSTITSLGSTRKVLFTAALPANALINNIMPRTFINGGADFATYHATNGVQAFTAYNNSNNLNTASVTDTLNLTASAATTASRTINAIRFNGTGLSLSGAATNRLTLSAGAVLNTGGDNAIDINEVAFAATTAFFQVAPTTTLTVNGNLTGSGGLAKALSGTLAFGAGGRSFITGTHSVGNGTLKLNGTADTFFPNQGLFVNVGATLDLNGGGQYVGALTSVGAFPGGGGTIQGGGAIVTNSSGTFAGTIAGMGTQFGKVGGGALTLETAQSFGGVTLLMGGTTTLENDASLLTTSAIHLNYAGLTLSNNTSLQTQNSNRVGDTIPISMRGGTISVTGRLSAAATETFGALNVLQGANTITATVGGGTFTSMDLTFASLNRTPGAGTVINFTGTNLGQQGNSSRILFTTPLTTVASGALGGWAIANTTDFAAYHTGLGVGVVGQGGFTGYDAAFGSGNLTELPGFPNTTSLVTLPGGTTTTGLLKFAGNNFNHLGFTAGGDVLDLEHGGLLRSNNNFGTSIGSPTIRGVLTAGGSDPAARELFIFNNGSANPSFGGAVTTIDSPVVTGINTTGLQPGMTVTNANFPAGTKVVSILNNSQALLSNNATATASAQTLSTGAMDLGSTTTGSALVSMSSTVGIQPGMTLTGTGIPAGSFVVSVDSASQVTISQNATASASNLTLTAGLSNVVIHSVIADNPATSAPVTLVKSGGGILTLTAPNTHSGGTIVNSLMNLAAPGAGGLASHVVIPAGGLTINNGTVTMLSNAGQIHASNEVLLRGGSLLTLVGNNTLSGLEFDNNGGTANPTVNSGGVLTLTDAAPITANSSNPATVATVAGNLNLGSGTKTIHTGAIQVGGVTVTQLVPTLNLSANLIGVGATVTKTGAGLLQVGGQSTFTGGLNVSNGGIVISASSSPAQGGAGITSGPVGSGTLAMAAGTTIYLDGTTRSLANAVTFAGNPLFNATSNTVSTLTLNGEVSGAGWSATPTVQVGNPGLTVALLGKLPAFSNITKTGPGTLIFNSTNYSGNYDAAALGNGFSVSLLHDGETPNIGNGVVETVSLGSVTFAPGGTGTVTVGRAGGTLPYNLAANKIIATAGINTVLSNGLTVINNNGYGLEVPNSGALGTLLAFTVNTSTGSNVTQGLYLTGALSGLGFVKTGAGTMVLGNAGNTFTGNVNINQGVLSVAADGALGNAANMVLLNPQTGTATFRATDSFVMNRVIQLSNSTSSRTIEVVEGETLTLGSAFDLNAGSGTAASLGKADNGTLLINAANGGWNGVLTISGGVVQVGNTLALGSATGNTIVSGSGAALRLPAGISIAEPLTLTGTGIATGGALQGTGSGTSIQTGAITLAANAAIGADAGNLLSTRGGISGAFALTLAGEGTIEMITTAIPLGLTNLTKIGSGTTTFGVASTAFTGTITVNRGSFVLGAAGGGSLGTTGLITVNQNGAFTVDNTTSPASRWSNRSVTLAGGTLNYNTNSAAPFSDISTGTLTLNSGASLINLSNAGTSTTELRFGALAFGAGGTGDITGLSPTSNLFRFTATPTEIPTGTGLIPRLTINGNEFASYDGTGIAGNGIVAFSGYAATTNVLSATATATYRATAATSNSFTGNQTLSALNLNTGPLVGDVPVVGGLGGLLPTTLTLTSGAILVNGTGAGASASLSVPIIALAGVEGIVHVAGGQTLSVGSGFSGTAGLTKSLGGTLNFNRQQYYSGTTTVNGGTLNLESGGTNTLLHNNTLAVNTGGTLDLNGGKQYVGALNSQGAGTNTDLGGGTIRSTAPATLVVASGGFGGEITGGIFLNKTSTGTLTLTNAQSYTGNTLISGGTLILVDGGTLNTPAIEIHYGSLTLANTGLLDNGNRVNNAPITMRGGNISFNGRAQTNSTETLGTVTLAEGHNTIYPQAGGTGINSADLTLGGLSRTLGSTATLRFNNLGGMGQLGSQSRVMVSGGVALTNHLIGPWAVVDREFASYDSTYGIGGLNAIGFPGYSGSGLNSAPLSTDNVRLTATGTTVLAANTTVGTLSFGSQTVATTLNLGTNTLTLQGGGLAFGQTADSVNFAITNGNLTGPVGGGDLYVHHLNYTGVNRTVSIDAAFVDNGGPIRVIKSSGDTGVSVMTWNGTNLHTGGTVLNQGTLILGAAGTLGSGGFTVNQGTFTQTAGGVIPAQVLTLGGGSVVTLAGANSLTGITFNNVGGAAPTLNPTGTLTLTGGINAQTGNAGAISTISNGTLNLNAAPAFSINVGATLVNGEDVAPWQAGLVINSAIQNGGITKSGDGLLQLSAQSTFTGNLNVTAGGLIIGASSTPSGLLNTVTSGPVGTGSVTMAANTTLLATAAHTLANNFTFLGDTVFNGVNSLTLNGITTLPSVWNATVTAPQMTVTIADASPSLIGDVINKSGLGTLNVGNYAGTINADGGLLYSNNGNTLGTVESLPLGGSLVLTGDTAITVNRSASGPNARNKILQNANLTIGSQILGVTGLNGYGLEFTGATTLTGAAHFSVIGATASNVVQGLTLSGVVDDGVSNFGLIKSGAGTLVLSNPGNTFGGPGRNLDILGGILSVPNDGALGDASNSVTLNVDGSTGVGFRATGTFTSGRTFVLNQPNNAFEVTQGNVMTLSAPFVLSAPGNSVIKNDNGVIAITANNSGWSGPITINAGAIRAAHANALGSGTITVNNIVGSALQLSGGVSIANPVSLLINGASGINSGGVIESVSGVNTVTGLVTQGAGFAVTYGAAAGATLNFNGNIATANSTTFNVGSGGVINLNSVYGNGGAGGPTLVKIGTGTLNVTVNQPAVTSAISVNRGTLNVSGSGVGVGTLGLIAVNAGGTLRVDDSVGAPSAHLGGRPLSLQGGAFQYLGNLANSAESFGALNVTRMGALLTSIQSGTGTVSLTFASLGLSTDASIQFQGTNLGTAANRVLFTVPPSLTPASGGILARGTVNGSTFATYGANGIAGFNAYNATSSVNINLAGATDTVDANAAMTTKDLSASRTINALRLSGATSQTVGGAAFNQLTLTSGGILATGASVHTLGVPVLALGTVQGVVHVDSGSSLNLVSTLTGTAGIVKDGAGTLILSPTSAGGISRNTLSGNTIISGGTLRLNGGTNTMNPGQFLILGGPGAVLDLNGFSQQISGLLTDTATPGSGGTITSGSGTGQLVINQDTLPRNFAGSFTGPVNLVRSGQSTLNFVSVNSHTGTTVINGNSTVLRDDGTFANTPSIDLHYASLTLDNSGFNDLADRINDAASLSMRGGTLAFQGRAQSASTETVGEVTLVQGGSSISSIVGGTGINSADLTLTSLNRAVGGGTVNFTAATGGLIGSSARIVIPTINGVNTATAFAPLNDGILGGWAVIGASDWASYIPGLGVGALGQPGFPQYSNTTTTATTLANSGLADNVNLNAGGITFLVNDDLTINSLRFGNVGTNTVNIAASKTLTLESGGLLFFSTAQQNLGAVVNQGNITSSGPELFAYTQGTGPHHINSAIVGAITLVKSGANTLNLAGTNTHTGGTTVNQGTLNVAATSNIPLATIPANGLIINNSTVTLNAAGAIAAGNVVTMNGVSTLNLFGNNTIEGLVLNNLGGGSGNLQINTFSTTSATGAGANGVLSIGNAGITATSSNISSATVIVGRTDFGSTTKTVDVAPIMVNGVAIAPLQSALILQGIVGTDGGITKTGNGVLQFNAQAHYTGPTVVDAGGLRTGVTNGGSRFSALTLGATTTYNLAGLATTWGSLAGAGTVMNSGGASTLTVGFDNTSTTFSGQLARFNDAVINGVGLQKVGSGILSMTAAQSLANGTTGTISIQGGSLRYTGLGAAFPGTVASGGGTFNVNNSGILALDNADTLNVSNRLGLNAVGTLNLQGGKLTLNGNSSGNTLEQITSFNLLNGGGRIELTPNATRALNLTLTSLSAANGNGAMVVGGINGSAVGTVGRGVLVITTPNLIVGQGSGVNGTVTMPVRHDILGDASTTGLGTGFLVRDTVGFTYRALAANELAPAIALPLTTDVDPITAGNQVAGVLNVGLVGATQNLGVNSVANTITFSGTNTVGSDLGTAFGRFGPGGGLLGFTLSNAAASLTLAGATANVNVGNFGSTAAGTTMYAHVITGGLLNVNGFFGVGNTGGLAKNSGGVMSLNHEALYTGATTINNGTLRLNSGSANTLAVVPTTGAATVSQINLNGNGAVLDLMGEDQAIGALTSINPLPGSGGTVQSTGGAATLSLNGAGVFSGKITGGIALTRAGNSNTTLTNAHDYTGATVVRGGTLELRDSGTIASTAGLNVNYGTVTWNNFGLNPNGTPNPVRLAADNEVTLQGGNLLVIGAGSTDTVVALDSVVIAGGQNSIQTLPYINEGSTVKLTIGNLTRDLNNHSGVNFNGFTTNNSAGSNTLGGQGLTVNSNIFLTQVNGSAYSASNLVNGLIGGWAVSDGSTFATYSNTFGVVAMGNTYGGFVAPAFTGTDISAVTVASGNYNDSGILRTIAASRVANSWRFAGQVAAGVFTFSSGATVSLGVGIISNVNQAQSLIATDSTNTLTGTGTDLYFYVNQNMMIIEPAIVGSAALVSNGGSVLSLRPRFASNTYSGGTFANAGTLNLSATAGFIAIPGDLTINNAAVTMSTVPNQIAPASNVVINGGGALTFANYATLTSQTLSSLTFTNEGGAATPTVSLGTPTALSTLILSSATPITSTNQSLATTPTISTGAAALTALQFSHANPTLDITDGLAETELLISAVISQHANMLTLSKTGDGTLALSGANTFTTGFNLSEGSLMFGSSSVGTPPAITSGPIGTGILMIADGTTILSDGTIRTVGNAVTVNGNFTLGGRVAGNGVILSGAMNLGASGRTLTVASPANTSTLSGAITSTATGTALTKAGNGTLILTSAANNFGGADVAITGGILKVGVLNAIPVASAVDVSAGAGLDLNNFDQTLDGISGDGFITNSANAAKTLTINSSLANSVFDGVLIDNRLAQAASALNLTKVGTATTLTLTGANRHSGTTTVTSGILSISNGAALGTTTGGTVVSSGGSLELQNDIAVTAGETLSLAGSGSAMNGALRNLSGSNTYAGLITLTGPATIQSDAGLLTLDVVSGNAIAAANHNLTVQGSGNVTIADAIATGSGNLTKAGAGTLILSAVNTYTGGTQINGGVVQVEAINAVGSTGAIAFAGGTLRHTATNTVDYSGRIANSTGAIAIDTNGLTVTYASSLAATNTGGLTKEGAGTLVLTAANNYTGTTTIAEGTLQLGDGNTSGAIGGSTAIVNDGILSFHRSNALVQGTDFGAVISGGGEVRQIGTGTTTLIGANTYSGGTTVESGILLVNNTTGSGTGSGIVTVESGATLGGTGSLAGNTTIDGGTVTGGVIGASGNLTFAGDLTMGAINGGTWLIDLVVGGIDDADTLGVAGQIDLGSNTSLNLNVITGGTFTDFTQYTIATYGSLNGTFNGLSEGAFVGGGLYTISYGNVSPGAITLTAVPEPGTLGLLGLALAGFFSRRIRRRRAEAALVQSAAREE